MKRIVLAFAALLALSCGGSTHTDDDGSLLREDLFPPADSLPEEAAAFVEGYAGTFIRDLSEAGRVRRESLLSAIRDAGMSRYGSSAALDAFAGALATAADSTSVLIGRQLHGRSKRAFRKEREAYARWRDYYRDSTVAVLTALRTVSVGGTAGGTWQAADAYDLADMNYTDQRTVLAVLPGRKANLAYARYDSGSLEKLDEWRKTQCDRARTAVQAYTDTDGVVRIPEEIGVEVDELLAVCGILDREAALFEEWLASREELFRDSGETDCREMTGRAIRDRLRLTLGL